MIPPRSFLMFSSSFHPMCLDLSPVPTIGFRRGRAVASALPASPHEAHRLRGALPQPGGLRSLRRRRGDGATGAAPQRRAIEVAGGVVVPRKLDRWDESAGKFMKILVHDSKWRFKNLGKSFICWIFHCHGWFSIVGDEGQPRSC